MRSMKDPAPSRLAYRINRLMLTPRFRFFLRYGLPVLLIAAVLGVWASDEERRDQFAESANELCRQVEERPEFLVRMMVVEGASQRVENEIRQTIPVDFPVSSFDLDLETLREAVEDHDPVARASVQVQGGGILNVTVEEREPVVVHRHESALVLLDKEGHRVTTIAARTDRPDLPLILGEGAGERVTEALAVLRAAAPVRDRVRGIRRVGERRWDLLLDRDQVVMLPEAAPQNAVERVMALNAAQDLLARDLTTIDFRNPRRPVLRLSDEAVDALLETRTRTYGSDTQ